MNRTAGSATRAVKITNHTWHIFASAFGIHRVPLCNEWTPSTILFRIVSDIAKSIALPLFSSARQQPVSYACIMHHEPWCACHSVVAQIGPFTLVEM